MQAVRQAASGFFYAGLSILLVVGSLSLALSERNAISPAPSTPSTTPSATEPNPTATTPPSAVPATPTVTFPPAPTFTPYAPTIISPSPFRTAVIACGPYPGWIKAYVVQAGDSLFHISTLYRTTVAALERANCKSGSLIYAGERLWVPNLPTVTPGVTIIPSFDTPTEIPTEPLTLTPAYVTATAVVTETATADP